MSLNVVFSEGLQPQNSIISILSNFYMIWKATLGNIVGTPPPRSPHIKDGDRTFQKLIHLGEGASKIFARKGG